MGKMKELTMDIEMMVGRGYTLEEIADRLQVSESLIRGFYLALTETQEPDYMQEVE